MLKILKIIKIIRFIKCDILNKIKIYKILKKEKPVALFNLAAEISCR